MKFTGTLNKMITMYENPVRYAMNIGDDMMALNALIGKEIEINFLHKHICYCGEAVDKVYRSNFCYDCYFNHPAAGEAIFRPELSKAHLGIADRDLEFESKYQLQPHIVYLANSGGLKVGVTRLAQKKTRWMDQGANSTIVLAETPNRFEAGRIEVALKDFISDKTHWQKMLKNEILEIDLVEQKERMINLLDEELKAFASQDNTVYHFSYPVTDFPKKVSSVNLGKNDKFTGQLAGIKGQYLIFEGGKVLNVRSHEGYVVDVDVR